MIPTADVTPVIPAEPMLPRIFRARRVRRETPDVVTLHIAPEDGGALPSCEPGQFNMLYAFGLGEAAISIKARSGGSFAHTIRAVGMVTRAMFGWKRDTPVGVRGPFGTPWPLAEAEGKDVLLIAGGIGLAPLWELLRRVLARRECFGHVSLLYGMRSPADQLYRGELERLRRRGDLHLAVTADRADSSWCGHVGVVTTLIAGAPFDPANALSMLCGPEIMMRFSARELVRRGMSESQIYVSLERNMKCAVGICGHCQLGPEFICRDGPVFPYDRVRRWLEIPEL